MKVYCVNCGYIFNEKYKKKLMDNKTNLIDKDLKVKKEHCPMCTLKFNDSDVTSSINIISLLKSELGIKNDDEFYIEDIDEKLKISNNAVNRYIENKKDVGWYYVKPKTLEKILAGTTMFYVKKEKKKIMNFIDFFKKMHNLKDDEPFCLIYFDGKKNKSIQKNRSPYTFKIKSNKFLVKVRDENFTDIYRWQQVSSKWIQIIFSGLNKTVHNFEELRVGYNIIKYSKLIFKEL